MAAGDISGYALPDYFFTPPLRGSGRRPFRRRILSGASPESDKRKSDIQCQQ